MPRHHVGAILTFLNVSAVLCFLCSYDLLKISLCFFSSANIIQIIDLNQIYLFFYAKKSRKRLRYLLLFMRTQQGNFCLFVHMVDSLKCK